MKNTKLTDILQWDIRSWNNCLNFWEKRIDWGGVNSCLELGAREGGLSLWLAMKNKSVVCSDIESAKETAEKLHLRYQLDGLISYQNIDATSIPFTDTFDIIIFKSVLGGIGHDNRIDKQYKAISEIHKALKPGGKLLFAENLKGSRLHSFVRRKFVKWGNRWRYPDFAEIKDFLQVFDSYELHTTGFSASFGRTEKQREILYLLDRYLLNNITPKSSQYIAYGIAIKGEHLSG